MTNLLNLLLKTAALLTSLGCCFGFGWSQMPGTPDSSFGQAGWVQIDHASYEEALKLAVTPNGRILLLESSAEPTQGWNYQGSVHAFDLNGQIDAGFGNGGWIDLRFAHMPSTEVVGMALAPDGSLFVLGGGVDSTRSLNPLCVLRLSANGRPDSSFGVNGLAKLDLTGLSAQPKALALQMDGKIVAVGAAHDSASVFDQHPIVCRLLPDGRPDSSFGGTGRLALDYATGFFDARVAHSNGGVFNDVAVLSDGRILCAGSYLGAQAYECALALLHADGRPDSSFHQDGIQTWGFNPGYNTSVRGIAALSDGSFALWDEFGGGLLAKDFYYDRIILGDEPNAPANCDQGGFSETALAMQPDGLGHVYLTGLSADPSYMPQHYSDRMSLVRVQASNGQIDLDFAQNGWFNFVFPNGDLSAGTALAVQTDGKVLMAGFRSPANNLTQSDLLITRLHAGLPLDAQAATPISAIQIGPNPCTEWLSVQGIKQTQNARILALDGRILQSQPLKAADARIDVTHLPAGLYLLSIGATTFRFVKQ